MGLANQKSQRGEWGLATAEQYEPIIQSLNWEGLRSLWQNIKRESVNLFIDRLLF